MGLTVSESFNRKKSEWVIFNVYCIFKMSAMAEWIQITTVVCGYKTPPLQVFVIACFVLFFYWLDIILLLRRVRRKHEAMRRMLWCYCKSCTSCLPWCRRWWCFIVIWGCLLAVMTYHPFSISARYSSSHIHCNTQHHFLSYTSYDLPKHTVPLISKHRTSSHLPFTSKLRHVALSY